MLNITASYFPTEFLLETISNYYAFPAVTRGLRYILEPIHNFFFYHRTSYLDLIICNGVW